MPPVQRIMSGFFARMASTALRTFSTPSPEYTVSSVSMPKARSFSMTTGVNVSLMRPDFTSLPVETMHAVLRT